MRRTWITGLGVLALTLFGQVAQAADHQDGPQVKKDPSTDITDVFAWMNGGGDKVYLVMDVFPAADKAASKFSNTAKYVFHTTSRDKLLAIHEKLNVVYLTEGAGRYTGLWSDAKVAADLDVPVAWVIDERSRVYGEGADNESSNIALDKWRRDMTNRMAKATERQAKAIEELLVVNTEIEAIKASMSAGPKEG